MIQRARRSAVSATAVAVAIAAAAATAVALPVQAQPRDAGFACAAVEPSRSRAPAYRRLPGKAHCEGFFERSVSQPFVELVSLTAGLPLADEAGTQITMRAMAAVPASLVVQPLRSGPFYRVDAALDPAAVWRWDAAPMLQATGLKWRDIGFLARARTVGTSADSAPAFVPVAIAAGPDIGITGTAPAATVPGGPAAGTAPAAPSAHAVLRASVRLSSLAWRAAGGPWRPASGALYAFQRVAIAIDLPAGGQALDVDVQGLDADGAALPMLQFGVLGPAGGAR